MKIEKRVTARMGKKAVVYVIIASFFISVMAVAFLILSQPLSAGTSRPSIERIYTMDRFISDFESDIGRAAYISAFRALLAMEEHVTLKGEYFTELEEPFKEAFLYGMINGTPYTITRNATLLDYQASVAQVAAGLGMDFAVNITGVELSQQDPWSVTLNISFNVNLTDRRGLASWNVNLSRNAKISILDLRDPIFSVPTYGKVQHQVKMANFTTYVNDVNDANDTTLLRAFVNQSLYRESSSAPSFLMRFMGNFSASPNGIESIVDIPALSLQDIPVNSSRSVVDYLYFGGNYGGNAPAADACSIQNMVYSPNWFKLDDSHLYAYNITGALAYSGC